MASSIHISIHKHGGKRSPTASQRHPNSKQQTPNRHQTPKMFWVLEAAGELDKSGFYYGFFNKTSNSQKSLTPKLFWELEACWHLLVCCWLALCSCWLASGCVLTFANPIFPRVRALTSNRSRHQSSTFGCLPVTSTVFRCSHVYLACVSGLQRYDSCASHQDCNMSCFVAIFSKADRGAQRELQQCYAAAMRQANCRSRRHARGRARALQRSRPQ